ncbi:MAG: hypothetical protein QG626_155, partial [Patescibacteria group bacterium]|nr:hypothetical protein [Patescibacteria group bacterium]
MNPARVTKSADRPRRRGRGKGSGDGRK